MSEKDLETSEIISQIKSLNEEIKKKEVEKSQKEGRLATLYERLETETGTANKVAARKIIRQKEKEIDTNISRLREIYTTLEGREEWKISMQKTTTK